MTRVFAAGIPEMSKDTFERLLKRVSVERREKISKLKIHSKKCQSLTAELLLRAVLVTQYVMCEEDIVIEKTPEGKPYLKGDSGFHISLSHCEGCVAVSVSDNGVGVDIERIRDIDLKIAKRFFTAREQEYVFATTDGQTERFFEVWTRKEALVKFMGNGLSVGMHACTVENHEKFKSFVFDGYTLSVCTDEDNMDDVSFLLADELLSEYIVQKVNFL